MIVLFKNTSKIVWVITSAKEVVCFAVVSVSKMTQKVVDEFRCNCLEERDV